MHISYYAIETAEIVSITFGCLIGAFSLIILLVSIVTSFYGLTSGKQIIVDYIHAKSFPDKTKMSFGLFLGTNRVASSTPSLIMLILLYPATIIWGCIFAGSVAISTLMALTEGKWSLQMQMMK